MSANSLKNRLGLNHYPFNLSSPAGLTTGISIIIIFLISILDLAGWIFSIPFLKSVLSGWIPMKIITAICFVFTATTLLALQISRPKQRRSKLLLSILPLFIFLTGIISLLEYILILNTAHISILADKAFFNLFLSESNRMALVTAVNFTLIGAALFFMIAGSERSTNIAHFIILPVTILSYFVPVSYLLGVHSIHEIASVPVALNTGIAFCAVFVSMYFLKPDSLLLRGFTSPNTGGIVARKLLPALMALPVVIGWLRLEGERREIFGSEEGVIFVAATYTICFLVIVWITARSVNNIDTKRLASEEALKKSHEDLEKRVLERTLELSNLNKALDSEILERIKAQATVEAERQRTNDLLELMPAYLILLTPDYHVAYANRYFREQFGEDHGRRCYEYLFNRTEPCEICETYKVLKVNKPLTWEWTGPNGRNYSIFDFPFKDTDGTTLIMEMGIDVTELKQAEEKLKVLNSELEKRVAERAEQLLKSEQRYRLLVDAIPDTSIHLFDPDKRFLIAGGPEIVKNGLDKSQIEGKTLREAYPPEVINLLEPLYDKALKGESTTFEHSFGDLYYLQQVIPLHDNNGQVNAGMVISTNITKRNLSEKQLAKYSQRMEILSETAGRLLISDNPQALVNELCEKVMRFLDCQVFFNFLVNNELGKLHLNTCSGIPAKTTKEIEWLDFGVAVCGCVARDGERIVAENIPETADPRTELIKTFGVKAYACHPLMSGEKVIGTLSFGTRTRTTFNEEDLSLMKAISDQVAIAMARVLADKELQSTKNHLEKLINYANAPIIVWNGATEITLFNHAFENLTGYSADEVVGQRLDFLFPKKTLKESKAWIKSTLKENLITVELPILTKDGEIRTVLWNSANIYDTDEKTVLSTVAQGNDITERREAEEQAKLSREKLDLAFENAGVGVWEWDIPSDILKVDERLSRMFGLDHNEEFTGSFESFDNFIFEEDRSHFRLAINKTLNDNIPFDTVIRIKTLTKDFNYINTRALIERDSNGKPLKMTGVCFDITGMKKGAEQALFSLNENLTRSNKELEQFAYVASHDLQEPLRMVSSFTQLLSMRYKDKLDENANEFISYAVDGAHRMQNLINDLLEYSRINTTGKARTRVDMHELLGQAIKNLRLQISEKNALVTNDELPVIIADGGQIVQLLQNLIANALKFCERLPLVHISAREEKGSYIFSVKDNGIGIEATYFEKIFQIFQRLHLKEEYHGTGIGLAICRRIAERHGGKIWVESSSKAGTTFSFSIQKDPVYN